MLFWITPSLALTDDGPPSFDANSALAMILSGHDGTVCSTEDVYTVLSYLGLTDAEIADKIDFAMGLRSIDPADIRF
jgi:hypothetical protein